MLNRIVPYDKMTLTKWEKYWQKYVPAAQTSNRTELREEAKLFLKTFPQAREVGMSISYLERVFFN
jgi:hypothetical protein